MAEIKKEDLDKLLALWAKSSALLQEMGKILLEQPEIKGTLEEALKARLGLTLPTGAKLGKGELKAVVKRADGSIRKTQEYEFEYDKKGQGKLRKRVIKEL